MKERPILFSGENVRAILEGRKTQTRRAVKTKHLPFIKHVLNGFLDGKWNQRPMPHGKPGDRLWVKETYGINPDDGGIVFRATDPDWETCECWAWRPSMFMRRMDSRITLEITGVRVEQLQDISYNDAVSEGVALEETEGGQRSDPISAYQRLWESINGAGSWEANPCVWVIEFKKI